MQQWKESVQKRLDSMRSFFEGDDHKLHTENEETKVTASASLLFTQDDITLKFNTVIGKLTNPSIDVEKARRREN